MNSVNWSIVSTGRQGYEFSQLVYSVNWSTGLVEMSTGLLVDQLFNPIQIVNWSTSYKIVYKWLTVTPAPLNDLIEVIPD